MSQYQDKIRTENQIEVDAEQGEERNHTVDDGDEHDARELQNLALYQQGTKVRESVRLRLMRTTKHLSSHDFVMLKFSHSHCAVAPLLAAY